MIFRDTQKQYENEFKMQPDVKNISSKTPIKIAEKIKDEEVKPTLTKTSNVTTKKATATNQTKQEPKNDLNNKKVRELELVELFRASLDQNVPDNKPFPYLKTTNFRELDWSVLRS